MEPHPQHLQSPHSRAHPFVVPAKAEIHVTPTSPSRHSRAHPFVVPAKAGTHVTRTTPSVRPERGDHETTNPKLNSYPNAASKTTPARPNTPHSYDARRPAPPQPTQNHPQNGPSQLRHETNETKLNSYDHAAIETTSSYEKSISSYGTGRTLANQPAQNTPHPDRT